MTTSTVPDEMVAAFSGDFLTDADPGCEEARRIHNGIVSKRPGLIVRCVNTADVRDAVNPGREAGAEISVRAGGRCG
jgi:hypothetical protein